MNDNNSNNSISRRSFLKLFGAGTVATAAALTGCKSRSRSAIEDEYKRQVEPPKDKMTFRSNPKTGDRVSLLGYGMMRLFHPSQVLRRAKTPTSTKR